MFKRTSRSRRKSFGISRTFKKKNAPRRLYKSAIEKKAFLTEAELS